VSERVFIIGPGHVGRGLFRAFRASGVQVVGLHGKRPSGVATSTGALPKELASANVVIVCVRDPQLDETIVWGLAWGSLALGAIPGPLIAWKLRRLPEAAAMAEGKR